MTVPAQVSVEKRPKIEILGIFDKTRVGTDKHRPENKQCRDPGLELCGFAVNCLVVATICGGFTESKRLGRLYQILDISKCDFLGEVRV